VAHRLEFLLPVFQTAFEVGDGAAGVLKVEAYVLAGFLVFLELEPPVGPEGDLLGEAFVDSGEGLIHVGDPSVGDFAVVLRQARIQGAASTSASSSRSADATGSRSRCGAQPAKMAERSGATRTNWRRLESTRPSPDLISWVSMKSRCGSSPSSVGSTSTAP
jgi:hypothetical protein